MVCNSDTSISLPPGMPDMPHLVLLQEKELRAFGGGSASNRFGGGWSSLLTTAATEEKKNTPGKSWKIPGRLRQNGTQRLRVAQGG